MRLTQHQLLYLALKVGQFDGCGAAAARVYGFKHGDVGHHAVAERLKLIAGGQRCEGGGVEPQLLHQGGQLLLVVGGEVVALLHHVVACVEIRHASADGGQIAHARRLALQFGIAYVDVGALEAGVVLQRQLAALLQGVGGLLGSCREACAPNGGHRCYGEFDA